MKSSKKYLLLFTVASLLCCFLAYSLTVNSPRNAEGIEEKITAEVPPAANRDWVQRWIIRQGWSYEYIKRDKSRSFQNVVYVRVDGDNLWPVTSVIHVKFIFDSQDKLQRRTVSEAFMGP